MIRDGCLGDNISAVNRQAATFSSNLHRVESGARLKATLLEWRTRRCAAVRFTRVLASLYQGERRDFLLFVVVLLEGKLHAAY